MSSRRYRYPSHTERAGPIIPQQGRYGTASACGTIGTGSIVVGAVLVIVVLGTRPVSPLATTESARRADRNPETGRERIVAYILGGTK
jgi:Flp pilus assembly protein protease CpaA